MNAKEAIELWYSCDVIEELGEVSLSDMLSALVSRVEELEADQQSVQPTCSTCGTKLRSGDIWWNECEKCHSKIASGSRKPFYGTMKAEVICFGS